MKRCNLQVNCTDLHTNKKYSEIKRLRSIFRISAVSDGEKFSYTYDINDNLTGIKKNDVTIFEAIYDAMGERVLTKELNSDGTLESKYRLNDVSFEDTQVLSVYNDSSKSNLMYGNERTVELSTGT